MRALSHVRAFSSLIRAPLTSGGGKRGPQAHMGVMLERLEDRPVGLAQRRLGS